MTTSKKKKFDITNTELAYFNLDIWEKQVKEKNIDKLYITFMYSKFILFKKKKKFGMKN